MQDVYIFQTQDGDEFVGRCTSMLNMMNGDFASLPPFLLMIIVVWMDQSNY